MTAPPNRPTAADAMLTDAKPCRADATVADVRAMFASAHLHAVVVVDRGVLVRVIDRADLAQLTAADDEAVAITAIGAVAGRVITGDVPLEHARRQMLDAGRRRLAVVDEDGRYRGLLCLKRSRSGFCSDTDVAERAFTEPDAR